MKGDRARGTPDGDTCSAKNLLKTSAGKFSWVCIFPKISIVPGPPAPAPATLLVNGVAVGSAEAAPAPRLGVLVTTFDVMVSSSSLPGAPLAIQSL